MTGLENFLKDEPVAEETVVETPQEASEEATEEIPAEKPEEQQERQEAPAEPESTGEEVSTPETEKATVPIAALMSEREKRQELEKKLAEKDSADTSSEAPAFVDDPEGAFERQKEENAATLIDMKVNMSMDSARRVYEDYDATVLDGTWEAITAENPSLGVQCLKSDNPAMFAYEKCKTHKQIQEIGDPATFKERVKAEILKEIEEDAKARESRENIPDSLAKIPAAADKQPVWQGDEPLGNLVGPERKKAS